MKKLDLRQYSQADFQTIIGEFDRLPHGETLIVISNQNPSWILDLVRDVRPYDVGDYDLDSTDETYSVTLTKATG